MTDLTIHFELEGEPAAISVASDFAMLAFLTQAEEDFTINGQAMVIQDIGGLTLNLTANRAEITITCHPV